jgi:hypothetical protein
LKTERAKDEQNHLDIVNRKNESLDKQRVKLKQYEFAIQECMTFLAKPLNKYVDWINENTTSDLEIEFAQHIPEKSYPKNESTSSPTKLSKQITLETPKAAVYTKSPSESAMKPKSNDKEMTQLEVTSLECMRLGFNFLHSCQKQIIAIDNGTYKIPIPSANQTGEESEALRNIIAPLGSLESIGPEIPIKNPIISAPISIIKVEKKSTPEFAEGDLSLEPIDDFQPSPTKQHCERCRKALLQVDQYKDKLNASEALIQELEARLHKEIKAKKIVQKAKDMMDSEIEEITAELFSRANQMVVDEAWKMNQLQTSNRELNKLVSDLKNRLKDKETELSQATKVLYDLQSTQMYSAKYSSQKETKELKHDSDSKVERKTEFTHSIISGFDTFTSSIAGDGFIFQEFQEFMRILVLSSNQVSTAAYQSIHSSLFMKRCMLENIEPTLFYTYQPNSSFKAHGPGLTQAFKKKLLDYCIRGQVSVKFDEREEGTHVQKLKCVMCTIIRECEYKASFGPIENPKPETGSLCRFCRDRVLATQDFFSFITYLSSGKHSATILSTFKKILWLKRRMALSIIGSNSLFETELSAILGPGGGGDWEKTTDIVY